MGVTSTTIFKKDTTGKTRYLTVEYGHGLGMLIQKSGVVGGKEVVAHKICKPKNIGKSNETTSESQAKSEALALINDKLTKGYFKTIEELNSQGDDVILPMLAKDYNKEKDKIDWDNCYIQPKLDGMRALIKIKDGVVTIWSRQGKEITTVPHINMSFEDWNGGDIILDGELYSHGISFQETMSLCKKFTKETQYNIKFYCYDNISNLPYIDRARSLPALPKYTCELVETTEITNEDELKEFHKNNIQLGYEGSIVRWGNEGYKKNGRSSNLLKYKDFLDTTATIVDVIPSDARPTQGVLVCRLQSGAQDTFNCSLKFSFEERERILANKKDYIGQTAEVRYFEDTDSGLPRFPVCVGFRLDK